VVDDLIPTDDTAVFRRDLARLVTQCHVADIKLVLTFQTHIWDFNRLSQDIPPSDIYLPNPEFVRADQMGARTTDDQVRSAVDMQQRITSSFILSEFT
jgi:hypothetical protein